MKTLKQLLILFLLLFCFSKSGQGQLVLDSLFQVLANTNQKSERTQLHYEIAKQAQDINLEMAKNYNDSVLTAVSYSSNPKLYIQSHCLKGSIERNTGKLEESLQSTKSALSFAQEQNDPLLIGHCINTLGQVYSSLPAVDSAKACFNRSLEIGKSEEDISLVITSLSGLGILALQYEGAEKAFSPFFEALELSESQDYKLGIATSKANLGKIYGRIHDFGNSLKYAQESLQLFEHMGHQRGIATNYLTIGTVYYIQGNLDPALEMCQKSADLYHEIGSIEDELHGLNNISGILAGMGRIDESIDLQKRVKSSYAKISANAKTFNCLINLADLHMIKGDSKTALIYADSAKFHAENSNSIIQRRQVYYNLFLIYSSIQDYEPALVNFQQYVEMKDSLFSESTAKNIQELEVKHGVEKKNQELELLEEKSKVKELELAQKNNWIFILAIGILSLILITILVVFRQRTTAKIKDIEFQRNKAELEQKILRAQMNPHFLFNSLNSIQRMYLEGETDMATDYMGDFGDLLRKILDNSGESVISVKSELDTLKLYLSMENVRTHGKVNYTIEVDEAIEQFNSMIPPLVIQPFVENAIWHGILPSDTNGKIAIALRLINDQQIECTVIDNGIGLEQSKKSKKPSAHKSKGIKITTERLQLENAVRMEEIESGGTKVTLQIPIVKK